MGEKQNDTITLFNIEVPKEVINDNKPPKNMQQKKPAKKPASAAQAKQERQAKQTKQTKQTKKPVEKKVVEEVIELPKAEPEIEEKPELSQSSLDMLASLEEGLKREEEEKVAKKKEMEEAAKKNLEEIIAPEPVKKKPAAKKPPQAQKRKVANKNAPTKKLATEEAVKASEEQTPPPAITEIKIPTEGKSPNQRTRNRTARPVKKNETLSKILAWIIPTHGDEMTEIIRKGLVIICIVVLIFSMGILFKSTRLEKKASEKNAGTYFVNKYVTSYDIYKDKEN